MLKSRRDYVVYFPKNVADSNVSESLYWMLFPIWLFLFFHLQIHSTTPLNADIERPLGVGKRV
jgi:hypothetical protein